MEIITKHRKTGDIHTFKGMDAILAEINRDHSSDFTPCTASDWKEGWQEWCKELKIIRTNN